MVPEVITYGAVISACEKGNQADCALDLFEEMKLQGLVSNTVVYNALIQD